MYDARFGEYGSIRMIELSLELCSISALLPELSHKTEVWLKTAMQLSRRFSILDEDAVIGVCYSRLATVYLKQNRELAAQQSLDNCIKLFGKLRREQLHYFGHLSGLMLEMAMMLCRAERRKAVELKKVERAFHRTMAVASVLGHWDVYGEAVWVLGNVILDQPSGPPKAVAVFEAAVLQFELNNSSRQSDECKLPAPSIGSAFVRYGLANAMKARGDPPSLFGPHLEAAILLVPKADAAAASLKERIDFALDEVFRDQQKSDFSALGENQEEEKKG